MNQNEGLQLENEEVFGEGRRTKLSFRGQLPGGLSLHTHTAALLTPSPPGGNQATSPHLLLLWACENLSQVRL